jgi:preprotein translocase subunit YajC
VAGDQLKTVVSQAMSLVLSFKKKAEAFQPGDPVEIEINENNFDAGGPGGQEELSTHQTAFNGITGTILDPTPNEQGEISIENDNRGDTLFVDPAWLKRIGVKKQALNSADVIGWAKDGEAYCDNCKPVGSDDEVKPIFGDEAESFAGYPCGTCGQAIFESTMTASVKTAGYSTRKGDKGEIKDVYNSLSLTETNDPGFSKPSFDRINRAISIGDNNEVTVFMGMSNGHPFGPDDDINQSDDGTWYGLAGLPDGIYERTAMKKKADILSDLQPGEPVVFHGPDGDVDGYVYHPIEQGDKSVDVMFPSTGEWDSCLLNKVERVASQKIAIIRKNKSGSYDLFSHKGKHLYGPASQEECEKREKQVEYFKNQGMKKKAEQFNVGDRVEVPGGQRGQIVDMRPAGVGQTEYDVHLENPEDVGSYMGEQLERVGVKKTADDPTVVARWETRGNDWIELYKDQDGYWFDSTGVHMGGRHQFPSDEAAIAWMESDEIGETGYSPLATLKMDRPSVRRVALKKKADSAAEYLKTFFEEKGLTPQSWEIDDASGMTHYIDSDVVIEAIMGAPPNEQEGIANMIRKIDFANGDVNKYLEHLAKGLVNGGQPAEASLKRRGPVPEIELGTMFG